MSMLVIAVVFLGGGIHHLHEVFGASEVYSDFFHENDHTAECMILQPDFAG